MDKILCKKGKCLLGSYSMSVFFLKPGALDIERALGTSGMSFQVRNVNGRDPDSITHLVFQGVSLTLGEPLR